MARLQTNLSPTQPHYDLPTQPTPSGSGKAAMVLADQQRKNRAELVASRTTEAGKFASSRWRRRRSTASARPSRPIWGR